MGRSRKQKPPKLSGEEQHISDLARGRNLWILFDGLALQRKWSIFSAATGKQVATYFPASGTAYIGAGDNNPPVRIEPSALLARL